MGFLSVIRRWALRDKIPIREISRRTGLSRNTIRKYLRADIVEPNFRTPTRPSKLDPFAEKLSGWLQTEQRKSRKDRRTAKQMHADLVQLGFDGSYERVAAFVRAWKADRQHAQQTTGRGTFVPLVFQPGEAFQFDWSEDWAIIGSERVKLQVAHIKLSHSRAFLVRAYLLQTHEMLFDAHWHAFRVFDGIPGRGIYDNMKTAVDRVGRGKQRDVNARFLAMTSHYVFEPEFCNPAAGWEKGQVEKNVRDARHRVVGVNRLLGKPKDLGPVAALLRRAGDHARELHVLRELERRRELARRVAAETEDRDAELRRRQLRRTHLRREGDRRSAEGRSTDEGASRQGRDGLGAVHFTTGRSTRFRYDTVP